MKNIRKVGDRYQVTVTTESVRLPDGPDGKPRWRQKRRKGMADTHAEARRLLARFEREAEAGVKGAGRLTVADWLDTWYDTILPARRVNGHPVSQGTKNGYGTMIRVHLRPAFAGTRLDKLTVADVERVLSQLVAKGMSRSSLKIAKTVLIMALTAAEKRDLVAKNVARLADIPGEARDAKVRDALTLEEAHALLEAAKGTPDEALVTLSLMTGARPGEILALRWSDVDLATGELRIERTLKRGAHTLVIGENPKNDHSRRTVKLPEQAVAALQVHAGVQAEQIAKVPAGLRKDTGLIFTRDDGSRCDPQTIRRRLSALATKAGIGHPITPHSLRHTAVTLLSDMGVPLERIRDQMGHAPGSPVTERVYRHRRPVVDDAAGAFEALFGAASTRTSAEGPESDA